MTHRVWQPPRLRQVAERAEVSLATASRVLSGRRQVEGALRQAVFAAARDLGYRLPDSGAEQGCIAVLATALGRIGYSETLTGIIEAAREQQLLVEIHIADTSSPALTEAIMQRVLTQPLVGVIVLDFDSVAAELTTQLPADIPVAIAGGLAGSVDPSRAHCYIDDFSAAHSVTNTFLELGHASVAYLGVPRAGHPEPREQGWRQALTVAHARVIPPLGLGWSASRGRRVAEHLAERSDITAVLCGNDELAIGLIAGLAAIGVGVPDEISVIGFDDHPLAAHCRPALTTVKQDFAELGRVTTSALVTLADGGAAEQVGLETLLIYRDSLAAPPGYARRGAGVIG